jgi:hypothetical protein
MEPEGLHVPDTCPYPEPARSSPYPYSPLNEVHFRYLGRTKLSVQVLGFLRECLVTR